MKTTFYFSNVVYGETYHWDKTPFIVKMIAKNIVKYLCNGIIWNADVL